MFRRFFAPVLLSLFCAIPSYAGVNKPTEPLPRVMKWIDFRGVGGLLSPYDGLIGDGNKQIIILLNPGEYPQRKQLLIASAFVAEHRDTSVIVKDVPDTPEGLLFSRVSYALRALSGDNPSRWKYFIFLTCSEKELNKDVIDKAVVKAGLSPELVYKFIKTHNVAIDNYLKANQDIASKLSFSHSPVWLAGNERLNGYMLVKGISAWTGE